MIRHNLEEFTRGWIVGDFEPNILRTKNFEFMVRHYRKGDTENRHVHKKADEITVIVNGRFRMNAEIIQTGDIIHLEPGEASDFECIEDGATAVIKTPSIIGDKYIV